VCVPNPDSNPLSPPPHCVQLSKLSFLATSLSETFFSPSCLYETFLHGRNTTAPFPFRFFVRVRLSSPLCSVPPRKFFPPLPMQRYSRWTWCCSPLPDADPFPAASFLPHFFLSLGPPACVDFAASTKRRYLPCSPAPRCPVLLSLFPENSLVFPLFRRFIYDGFFSKSWSWGSSFSSSYPIPFSKIVILGLPFFMKAPAQGMFRPVFSSLPPCFTFFSRFSMFLGSFWAL